MPPPPNAEVNLTQANRISRGMAIALTIAIVLPPTLLLGAILGYLIGLGRE